MQISTVYDKYPSVIECYRYPHMAYVNWFNKVKFYSIPFVSCSIITVTYFIDLDELSPEHLKDIFIVCSFILAKSWAMSMLVNNYVGFIYVNPKSRQVVVSYLNFWGNRIDEKFEPGDLYFQPRANVILKRLDKIYIFLCSRKKKRTFRINLSDAEVTDVLLLQTALGEIPESAA